MHELALNHHQYIGCTRKKMYFLFLRYEWWYYRWIHYSYWILRNLINRVIMFPSNICIENIWWWLKHFSLSLSLLNIVVWNIGNIQFSFHVFKMQKSRNKMKMIINHRYDECYFCRVDSMMIFIWNFNTNYVLSMHSFETFID